MNSGAQELLANKVQEKSIWREQFNAILKKEQETELEEFFNILAIVMDNEHNPLLPLLFRVVGLDNFIEIVNSLSGHSIKIPARQDFQDTLILALFKYYRDIKHLSWEETKKQVDFDNFAPMRIGRRLAKLDKELQNKLMQLLEEEEDITGQQNEERQELDNE